ncbi:diaminopimelate epimerase [Candidatus Paracaedibacter symbiosus]|uniref:diaminopimelate epimerase n=1 Tax=Candidatus Paracaedibacter symbiosus TaxID=244582 RepID=UPI000509A21A|nr:diaminopimelate epimerase [Candidatus Paracaedibacter symbiosus]
MIQFYKAHGLGNDFVIFEAPENLLLSPTLIQKIADRRHGIGCDQVIVYRELFHHNYHVRFYNSDGGEIAACGNGSRALGRLLFDRDGKPDQTLSFHTKGGILKVFKQASQQIQIELPMPKFHWTEIPQHHEGLHALPIIEGQISPYYTLNVGNPHLVAFFENVSLIDVIKIGPMLEHHSLFPQLINVSFAEVRGQQHLKLIVWERGSGLTGACGTAACATAVLAIREGLVEGPVTVTQPGGDLIIEWKENQPILMTGPATITFRGEFDFGGDI